MRFLVLLLLALSSAHARRRNLRSPASTVILCIRTRRGGYAPRRVWAQHAHYYLRRPGVLQVGSPVPGRRNAVMNESCQIVATTPPQPPQLSCDVCPCGYFDGCNTCSCDNGYELCTLASCQVYGAASCRQCPPPPPLPPPPPSCLQYGDDCVSCLSAGCSHAANSCLPSCNMIADTFCYSTANGSPAQVCARKDQNVADNSLCQAQTSCGTCTTSVTSDGSTCQWFGTFCSKDCGFAPGCQHGTRACEVPPPPPACFEFGDCRSCLAAGCSFAVGQCSSQCPTDVACYTGEPDEVCARANQDAADDAICRAQTNCQSCATAVTSDGPTCQWYGQSCDNGCTFAGCGTRTCGTPHPPACCDPAEIQTQPGQPIPIEAPVCCPNGEWTGNRGDGSGNCNGVVTYPAQQGSVCKETPPTGPPRACCDPIPRQPGQPIPTEASVCCPNGEWVGNIGDGSGICDGVKIHLNQYPICSGQQITCPADARPCPDGSYVVRDPANSCQFPYCPPTCPTRWKRRCRNGSLVGLNPARNCRHFLPCPN